MYLMFYRFLENDQKDEGCAEVNGYLDFGEFLPGKLIEVNDNKNPIIKLLVSESVTNWDTAKEAMDECIKGNRY